MHWDLTRFCVICVSVCDWRTGRGKRHGCKGSEEGRTFLIGERTYSLFLASKAPFEST